jgi:hypothetical protein
MSLRGIRADELASLSKQCGESVSRRIPYRPLPEAGIMDGDMATTSVVPCGCSMPDGGVGVGWVGVRLGMVVRWIRMVVALLGGLREGDGCLWAT